MKRTLATLTVLALVGAVVAPALAAGPNGQELYEKKCAMCHGKDGVAKATGKGSGNFNDPAWQEKNTAEAIVTATTDGIKDTKMPAYKDKLTADEIKAIAEYIKTLK